MHSKIISVGTDNLKKLVLLINVLNIVFISGPEIMQR